MWTVIPGSLGLIVLGAVVLVTARILYATGAGSEADPIRLALRTAGVVLFVLGIVGGCFVVVPIWILPLSVVSAIVIVMGINRYRAMQQKALLVNIAIAAKKGVPLGQAASAFSLEQRGRFGVLASALAARLEQGMPFDEAARRTSGALPPGTETAARIGHETSRLGEALTELAVSRRESDALWRSVGGKLAYLFGVLLCALAASQFLLFIIAPRMRAIVADFQTTLPPLTQFVNDVSATRAFWMSGLLMTAALGVALVYTALLYTGWLPWMPPIVRRVALRFEAARTLRSLAMIVDADKPLVLGVSILAESHANAVLRGRFRRVEREVTRGADCWTAMRRIKLISDADEILLESAQRVGNLAWAMRETATSAERRITYRLQAAVQFVFPLLILAFGLFVFVLVTGYFLPMVNIIQKMVP